MSERALAVAVLYQAMRDAREDVNARAFLLDSQPDGLLAFWCAVAGVSQRIVHQAVKRQQRKGWPGVHTRTTAGARIFKKVPKFPTRGRPAFDGG